MVTVALAHSPGTREKIAMKGMQHVVESAYLSG
jgi:hypothetical protein